MMMRLAIGIAAVFIATAAAQAQCPAVGQAAKEFALAEGFQPDPSSHNVTAGGDLDLGRCTAVPGKGWVTRLPDFIVRYKTKSGGQSRETLTFRVESSADTILLINDPSEKWHWNDDGGKGLNAKISFPRAKSGRYDIWVGSLNRGQLPKAKLVITELESTAAPSTAAAQAQCPAVGQAAKEFALAEGFQPDPSRHNVTAGGDLDLARCAGVPGKGWVTRLPDFIVRYKTKSGGQSRETLTFRVESSADTILLINDPSEKWHWNDDGGKGLNAKIRFPRAKSGRYDIWVGSYKQGQLPSAKLVVTEID